MLLISEPCGKAAAAAATAGLSVKQQYKGGTVLLTGGLGFLGSVVLEQLLRCTEVQRIYVLARPKGAHSPQQRVTALLHKALFHQVRTAQGLPALLQRVVAVPGDLTQPGLGLSPADEKMLQQEVTIILHSAASIELAAEIQRTLRTNYLGTAALLSLASSMPNLAAFVHTSTFYANNHLGGATRNPLVGEQLYPLDLGGTGHHQLVEQLMGMNPEEASALAAQHMQRNGFASTYAFGKHLTELLVEQWPLPGVGRALVRPALVAHTAAGPYPGFMGNLAGPIGLSVAYGLGLFAGRGSVAFSGDHLLDLIPADVVSGLMIAAGAAAAAEARWEGPADAVEMPTIVGVGGEEGGSSLLRTGYLSAAVTEDSDADMLSSSSGRNSPGSCSSSSNSVVDAELLVDTAPVDKAALQAAQGGRRGGQQLAMAVYHASSSISNPLELPRAFKAIRTFCEHNPEPGRLPLSRHFDVPHDYVPNPSVMAAYQLLVNSQVKLAGMGLRAAGLGRAAVALERGFKAWCCINHPDYARSLRCSVDAAAALGARLVPEEQEEFLLVWDKERHDWDPYLSLGMAAGWLLLRKQRTAVKGVEHGFRFIPDAPQGTAAPAIGADSTCAPAAAGGAAAAGGGATCYAHKQLPRGGDTGVLSWASSLLVTAVSVAGIGAVAAAALALDSA